MGEWNPHPLFDKFKNDEDKIINKTCRDDGSCCNTSQCYHCNPITKECENKCDPTQSCCAGGPCCGAGQNCCTDYYYNNMLAPYCCGPNQPCCKNKCCDPNKCETCVDVNGVSTCKPCGGEPNKICCSDANSPYCCDSNQTCCNGNCCEQGQCCVNGSCIDDCKSWDIGDAISGSINVQDAKLCEQKTHTSSISDKDHWKKKCPPFPEGTPSDSLVYSWSKMAGTNPQTGTWTTGTTNSSISWQAPPCVGTVIIKLTSNDVPNPMDAPCLVSTRDDAPKDFEGTSTVFLPDGCSEGTKSASLQSQIVGTPTCPPGTCGATQPIGVSADIEAKYNGCKWIFHVTALADVLSGACPSNYCNIENGNESCITENNYCGIVWRFIHTDGCVDLQGFIPSSTPCVEVHEAKHYEIFEREFGNQESWLLDQASMNDMTIDCADPNTTTCQAAVASRRSAIESDIVTALNAAWTVAADEADPIAAAYLCFYFTADAICQYALYNGWGECSYCPIWP